ncbi:MAG: GHKL domain-containing protein [Taibaiella sp.]|nr:GHKL domain-containing protein [Taibaiella sp.]
MFRRYPYIGWLLLSILLWCAAGYHYHAHRQQLQPDKIARTISNDIIKRQKEATELLRDSSIIHHLLTNTLSEPQLGRIKELPFYVFAYNDHDSLISWNNNAVLADCIRNDTTKYQLIRKDKSVYLSECVQQPHGHLLVLYPIAVRYPLENEYLRSHFVAGDQIPANTQILSAYAKGSKAVKELSGNTLFFVISTPRNTNHLLPDVPQIILTLLALLASITWIQLLLINLSTKRTPSISLLAIVLIIVVVRGLLYIKGLPFGFENAKLFTPGLYASSNFLPSLGDFLLNSMCLLWIVVFVVRHIPFRNRITGSDNKWVNIIGGYILLILLTAYTFAFVNAIRSLVLDSNISFDVSHFYSINIYTITGLFTIGILTAASCLIIYVINEQINTLLPGRVLKYISYVITGLLIIIIFNWNDKLFYYLLIAWLLLFITLLDVRGLRLVSDLFAPNMVFWAIFICTFGTAVLHYFNHIKESQARKVFADQRITSGRDDVTEYTFASTAEDISADKIVASYLKRPTGNKRKDLNEYLDAAYLNGQLSKYQTQVYIFGETNHNLYNKDTITYKELINDVNTSIPTSAQGLYYKDRGINGHNYIAYIRIDDDSATGILGYIFINLTLKQNAAESVYPELLQPEGVKSNMNPEYAYGIYEERKLITHTNDYPFSDYLKDTMQVGQYTFHDLDNSSELWYRHDNKKTIIVVHTHKAWIEVLTLFSYLFGIEMLIVSIIVLYQVYLSFALHTGATTKVGWTLRRRILFSMLGVVLLSFLIIGVVTIWFFRDEYQSKNKSKLESAMQVVEQSLEEYVKSNKIIPTEESFDAASKSTRFKLFLNSLADEQKIDINLFDISGMLQATSQDEIYERGLQARIIRADAYYQLNTMNKSFVIQNEEIGTLSYLSCYVPLHDEHGNAFGYINVPFFSSEKDLNFQISNIVVTLINLYAFIFLVATLITVFLTRWLTKTFNIIIKQFSRLNLQRNERITWPYDDEIGQLVSEYNKMVKKVEENATLLAQSEREGAWREMARQVAHEIKNPLTPMKLNIQYLQQALRNDQPNVKELAEKVAASLVEQIDNLSYIASEFSNFAKMPEARPEDIDVNNLIESATELYRNDENILVTLEKYATPLIVYSDRSQLLRVFTNLLENAKQAIEPGHRGIIYVALQVKDNKAIVSIADNGGGIKDDIVTRIFEPYFTTKSSGTGLGLAMTKKIIEFWKGAIWFETKEGVGTTFFIELPLV